MKLVQKYLTTDRTFEGQNDAILQNERESFLQCRRTAFCL